LIRHGKRIRRQEGRSSPKNESAARRSPLINEIGANAPGAPGDEEEPSLEDTIMDYRPPAGR